MLDKLRIVWHYLDARLSTGDLRPAPVGPVQTPESYAASYQEHNRFGLTLEQAREIAMAEQRGALPRFPGYSFGLSSGTMGVPGVFITSEAERLAWTGCILGRYLSVRQLLTARIGLILKHNNALYNQVRLQYFDAGRPVEEWAQSLCQLAPTVLVGPVSVLEQVAESQAFGRKPFRPEVLVAGAEPLFPQDRAFLTAAYGVAPRSIYQAREGFLAYGCERGRMHWNQDLIQVEFEPFGSRHFPIITDLRRTTQIYRRYRMDDLVIEGSCDCGSPLRSFALVEGRRQDVLRHAKGEPVFPSVINDALGRPRHYTVRQGVTGGLELAGEGDAAQLRDLMGGLAVERVPFVRTRPGEKRRRFQRLCDAGW